MAKSDRHKKLRRSEKAKTKLKQPSGIKKLAKAQNVIEPTFRSKKILIREQLKDAAQGEEITLSRHRTIQDVLSSLNHHNTNIKKDALCSLDEIIGVQSESLYSHMSKILEKICALTSDIEDSIRKETLKVANSIFAHLDDEKIQPFWSIILTYTKRTLTHIDSSVRYSSLNFLSLLLSHFPHSLSASLPIFLPLLLSLISSQHPNKAKITLGSSTNSRRTSVLLFIANALQARNNGIKGANQRAGIHSSANQRAVNYPGANQRGGVIGGANQRGGNLGGGDIEGANGRGGDLGGANQRGRDLGGGDLVGADQRGEDLVGANQRGGDLGGANERGGDLVGAKERGGANQRGGDLGGANERGGDLVGAKERGGDLGGANERGGDLRGANQRGGNLGGTNEKGGDFVGVRGANENEGVFERANEDEEIFEEVNEDEGTFLTYHELFYEFGYSEYSRKASCYKYGDDATRGETEDFWAEFAKNAIPLLCQTWIEVRPESDGKNSKKDEGTVETGNFSKGFKNLSSEAVDILENISGVMSHLLLGPQSLNSQQNFTDTLRDMRKCYGGEFKKYFFDSLPFCSINEASVSTTKLMSINLTLFHIAASMRLVDNSILDHFQKYIALLMKKKILCQSCNFVQILKILSLIPLPNSSSLLSQIIQHGIYIGLSDTLIHFLNSSLNLQNYGVKWLQNLSWSKILSNILEEEEINGGSCEIVTIVGMRNLVEKRQLDEIITRNLDRILEFCEEDVENWEKVVRLLYYTQNIHLLSPNHRDGEELKFEIIKNIPDGVRGVVKNLLRE